MKRIVDILLRWKLELKRFFNGGKLTQTDWETLYELRGEEL